jgi:hypothetical protein
MKTEAQLKQELQNIENDLQSVQTDLQSDADYEEKEFASDIIRAFARYYENFPPANNLEFPFQFKSSQVGTDPYLVRLLQAFASAGKVCIYNFI